MNSGRQELVVNLSGAQKNVLGFATWTQVSITAAGIILGSLVFTLVKFLLSAIGLGAGAAVLIALVFFVVVVAPFAYIAFWPIRDKQGDLLYYMNKQIMIDRDFEKNEVGSYLNIQENHHPVNQRLPYAPNRKEELSDAEEQ
ncbi:hypothetical protein [Limosilactobacillus vaginalis]|uniref:hypothetical protein n=1 Tax=Limosilactobacillus vaginalis TaxID=1633 RepID=UPI0024BB09DF|nr:hypothetical protein [Limosilactobacillus vaginalis]